MLSYKRLERGHFAFAREVSPGVTNVEIAVHELSALLEGLVVSKARAADRWSPLQPARA